MIGTIPETDMLYLAELGQNGTATLANTTPLINQLVAEINNAHNQIALLPPSSLKLLKRQDLSAIAGILTPLLAVSKPYCLH